MTKTVVPRDDVMDNVTQRLLANALCIFTLYYDAFDRFSIEPSGCRAPIFTPKCVAAKVVSRQQNKMEPSCCHVATSDRGCGWEDYSTQTYCPTGSEHQAFATWQ